MERLIKVAAIGDNLVIDVDGTSKSFSRDREITAQAFFEALRYKPKDKYTIEKGDCGDIPQDVFDSFFDLANEIITGINKIAEPEDALGAED